MKTIHHKWLPTIAALIAASAITLSSCSSTIRTDSEISLNDYEWAIFMSNYRDGSLLPNLKTGYVAFIREDGTYTLTKNSGMESGEISWTEHGVNYTDVESDHWITPQTTSLIKQKRTNIMDGLVTLSDSITRVGIYNVGFQKDGYNEGVIISRPEASEYHILNTVGFYPLVSACADNVYGAYAKATELEDPDTQFVFDQVIKDKEINHSTVASPILPVSEMAYFASDAPCVNGKISFLASFLLYKNREKPKNEELAPYIKSNIEGYDYVLTVVTVDSVTYKLDWHPLITEDGNALPLSLDNLLVSKYDAHSLSNDGYLTWIAGNGVLYKTNIHNGQTIVFSEAIKNNDDGNRDNTWFYHFSATNSTINILAERGLTDPRILELDKSTGKIIKDLHIKGLQNHISSKVRITDIAKKPESIINDP